MRQSQTSIVIVIIVVVVVGGAFRSSKQAYQRHQIQCQEISCMCKCVYMDCHAVPLAMILKQLVIIIKDLTF